MESRGTDRAAGKDRLKASSRLHSAGFFYYEPVNHRYLLSLSITATLWQVAPFLTVLAVVYFNDAPTDQKKSNRAKIHGDTARLKFTSHFLIESSSSF